MTVLLFFIVSYILLSLSLYLLFPKLGIEAKKGLIPGVNFIECMKAVGRPTWHAALLLVPIVNFFIYAGLCVEMVRSFGKYKFWDSALAVIYAPLAFFKLAKDEKATYIGPSVTQEAAYAAELAEAKSNGNDRKYKKLVENNPYKKTQGREWIESIVFAVFAAAFIRMFLIEAYVIPTPSMEGSLNVGDYLFVSKAHFGIRTPMTVAMFPLLHNRMPFIDAESYLEKPSLPYYRLPAIESIDRNEPIVFNWPVGDSVYVTKSRPYTVSQVSRDAAAYERNDPELRRKRQNKDIISRPIDKKDHYIKRCVAIPGDNLEIIDGQIFIDGKKGENPEHLQFFYKVVIPQGSVNFKKLDEWGIDAPDIRDFGNNVYGMFLDAKQVEQIKSLGSSITITKNVYKAEPGKLYPHSPSLFRDWSIDNFGPIWIPEKGATIQLTKENIALYKQCIVKYELNTMSTKGGKVTINGEPASEYTFKQDYFWAMGDNRHNSEDSRAWGFVPHDHIVGKPLFIWFSKDGPLTKGGINWDRIFKSANDMN